MSVLKEIIEGHVNELKSFVGANADEEEKIFKIREKICLQCPLKVGNTCNKKAYLNPKTMELSKTPKIGYYQGCGCRLSAKQKSPGSKCPASFWGGEFK